MKYMLDTDLVIELIKHKPHNLINKIISYEPGDILLSSITLAELEYRVVNSSAPNQNQLALISFLNSVSVISFDSIAAMEYGHILAELEKENKYIRSNDILIAAHAIAERITLITNDLNKYSSFSDLKVECWN